MQAERPETMKAWTYRKFGNPQEVLELTPDQPVRLRKTPTELIVKVHAAAINPVDWKMCEGYLSLVAGRPPITAGFDFSGVVVEVGPKVRKFKVGDEVYGMTDYKSTGSFAEYLTIRENLVAPKPKNLSHVEAASIPLVGLTTYQGLAGAGKHPLKGLKVLIVGGSSGTGSFGVQLAKHEGAEVTAVCSTKNVEFVQELGAARVIDYTQEDWGEVLKGQNYDVVYDCVGGEDVWVKALQVLSPKGRFATIAGDKQEPVSISKVFSVAGSIINRNFWNLVGSYPSYVFVMCEASGKQLTAIGELIEKGIIKPTVAHVYKFEEAKEMFAESMSNRVRGKLVLGVTEEGETEKESQTITEEEEQPKEEKEEKDEGKGKDKEVTEEEHTSVPADSTEGEEEKPKDVENKEEL